jgi:hypothetical protein
LGEFLDDFPPVTREQAAAALEQGKDTLLARAHSVDECLPRRRKGDLTGHEARTVPEMCWGRTQNGDLLPLRVADHFEALLTVDPSLPFQQNLRRARVGVVVV